MPAVSLNVGGTTSNSKCAVTAATSAASGSGNTLTPTLNITFISGFAGNRVIYTAALGSAEGNNTDWQAMGT